MFNEYSKYYSDISDYCIKFMNTMDKIHLNEEKEAAELSRAGKRVKIF